MLPKPKVRLDHIFDTGEPKPRCSYYNYSNPESQGALVCQTEDWTAQYDARDTNHHHAYSDRIQMWSQKRFDAACKLAGGGDQVWAYRLPGLSDAKLKEFARVALDLKSEPLAVRIVHHFNIATGYSCPTVEALVRKEPKV